MVLPRLIRIQFINSDDELDDEKSESEDEEEGNDAEHAPP